MSDATDKILGTATRGVQGAGSVLRALMWVRHHSMMSTFIIAGLAALFTGNLQTLLSIGAILLCMRYIWSIPFTLLNRALRSQRFID